MAHELAAQGLLLQAHRQVPLGFTPLGDPFERTGEAVFRRLALNNPAPFAGLTPQVSKTEKVEAPGAFPSVDRAFEVHQLRLLGMQGQSKPAESLRKHLHYSLRILLGSEDKHGVVCIANEKRLAAEPGQDILHEPDVEHLVKV